MSSDRPLELGFTTPPVGTWVQTDRAAHEKWAMMAVDHPRASSLLHVILHRMGRHNALVVSQKTLAKLAKCSRATLQRSLDILRGGNWIEIRQVGESGTVNAYIVNDRVAWTGARDGIRYSMFTAEVIVSAEEQPDRGEIDALPPLQHIPSLLPGEQQLPTGPGLPPVSQPSIEGMEMDLPTRRK